MATDVMRVRLHLRGIRVTEVLVDEVDELRVAVESTAGRSCCEQAPQFGAALAGDAL